ncbi:polymorphic outer membrane protein,chlamydial polymorphic outer membrane protein repeat,Chlamydia polymorphic membrane protein middle domain [Chlamydia suis]|uniref:polymorphic outer membrane protein middle domain-containing protein n=1 Tax=Chlamydia suis TaxID=83559 RepID=UPI0009AFCA43|nr:polymorphic outer membrane protein middle domain-containing protein [Chlamydia suis]SIU03444.1 polymorphic outer membrane protein,chlamydial polymorphic outer membrane protein repeat,Chlamydia polymorphic membrane protein middle domain [Chlamydia suis]
MKFLSATAVFAAALPSVTEANSSESPIKLTDSNRTGSSSQFTEIIPDGGAEYEISGNVSFSSFSNIPEEIKDPSPAPEHEENADTDEDSSPDSRNTNPEETPQNPSSETPRDDSQASSSQESDGASEDGSSSTPTASPSTPPEQPLSSAIALRSFLYSLQAETEERAPISQDGGSNGDATPSEPTEEGQQEPRVNNTISGGGAFYNNHEEKLSLVNNPENPGSLTLSNIRVTGAGGAIYSKGPLSIKNLKQLVLEENLSKQAGGAILGESTVTISGVDTLTFTKNAVKVTFVDKSETEGSEPEGPSGSPEAEAPSGSSNASDNNSSGGGSNGVPSTPQAAAFSRFLSASPSLDSQPNKTENTNSTLNFELGCGGGIYSKDKLTVSNSKEISFNENSATKDGGGIYSENEISVSTAEKVLFTGNTAGVVGTASATDKEQTPTDQKQGSQESTPDSADSHESSPNPVSSQPSNTASARLTQLSLTRSASTEASGSNGQENRSQQGEQDSANNQQGEDSSDENSNPDQPESGNDQSSGSPSSGGESPSPTSPQSPAPEVIQHVVGSGGAVYTKKSLTVTDVTKIELVNNSATGDGGAIYAADKVAFTTTTASDTSDARDPGETTISDNKASGCGGGVCTKAFSASNLKTLTLSKNTSEKSGGAIYTDLDALKTPENSETKQPTPPPSIPEAPAAAAKTSRFVATTSNPQSETVVDSPDNDIDVFINKVLSVAITENKAAKKGGGVYGKKAKFSNLDKLDISNNTAQDIGGGLCLTESVEFDAIGSLSTSNNSAIAQGAGIHAKTVTITNTKSAFTFANNTVKATEDPKPEVTQPEETAPSDGETPPSTPNDGQDQTTSPENGQTQGQSGAEGRDSAEASDVSNGQEAGNEGGSASNRSNQPEALVSSNSDDGDQAEAEGSGSEETSDVSGGQEGESEEGSASTSSPEPNGENNESRAQNLSETSQGTSENTVSAVENSEPSSPVSSESSTTSQGTQAAASSRVAILSSTNTDGSSGAAASPSEASESTAGEEDSESEAASPGASQPAGSSDSPTLVAGGAIWGDTVKIENFSGNGTFSKNTVIDNKNSGSTANVLGGAIYAKTSLDINNGSSNRSIIFSDNSVSSKSTEGQVAGGAIFSPTVTIKAPVVFSKNSATHKGTNPKDTFGGAIGATTSVSISKGARFSENTADIGSAIGLVAGAIPVDNNSVTATVSDPGTTSTTPDTQNKDTVRLEGGSYYFEKNKALKRATIYAPTVSIKAYTATFNQNSSAEEGSAIYFTKEASIESLGSVLFTGNLVTPTTSTAAISTEAVKKYGAAIFGQIANTNGTQPTSQTTTDNLPLKLIASGGNISFRNNEYRPTATAIGQSTFCSIGGDVKLSMQAAEGKTISFFDAIQTTTKKTGTRADAYDTLDINAGAVNSAFTGTIMFSSELHENKSYIPQNVVLHSGSLVLKANTELHVISFEQKEGSSLIMEPGAVLSNQATADGSLVINNLTIDLSSVGTTVSPGGGLFTPPELRIVDTTSGGNSGASAGGSNGTQVGSGGSVDSNSGSGSVDSNSGGGGSGSGQDATNAGNGGSSTGTDSSVNGSGEAGSSAASSPSAPAPSSTPSTTAASAQASITKNLTAAAPAVPAVPATTGNKVIIDGVITLVDPNGTFFQNPALGSNQTISLLVLPKDPNQMQAQKVVLTGDVSPQKGYTGTFTLDLSDLKKGIQAQWTFKSYRQWVYIPRDNHFYANSILGSQMSMATVKQGLINDKLNLARFDEVAYNNLWVSGVGTKLSQRGGPRSEEMTYYSRGASVALDAKPAQDLIIGAAFSKMIGRSKSLKQEHNYTHKGSEYSYQASVYGGRPFHLVMNRGTERTLPLLLQGVISYGYIKHDTVTHYPTIRERNKGEWEDLGWLAALRLSSVLKAPTQGDSKRISVFGEFEYSSIRQKQFTETEYDPRYFGNCTYRNLATPLGIALEGEFKGNDILMYNRFSVAYMPSIYRNSPVCKYKVLSSGEGGEIICGVPTRNTSRAEYSTQLYLGPLWTLYGSYTLEADAHTLANMINCGARMTF